MRRSPHFDLAQCKTINPRGTNFLLTSENENYRLDYRDFISFHIISGGERMELLTAKEAAQYLRISLFTLARIEKEGMLVPFRTPGGHRRYDLGMLDEYLEQSRSGPTERKKRILIVDEGEEVVELLSRTLSSHQFSKANDALEVGTKLAEFKPHLVLVNTRMSGLDGPDLCQRLSTQGDELKVLPFEALREGEEGVKGKGLHPPNLDDLTKTIESALGK
jgi:excisionase family DNA binding protein